MAPDEQGSVSASLQISDAMFAAVALGLSGTLLPQLRLESPTAAYAVSLGLAAATAVVALLLTDRTRSVPLLRSTESVPNMVSHVAS